MSKPNIGDRVVVINFAPNPDMVGRSGVVVDIKTSNVFKHTQYVVDLNVNLPDEDFTQIYVEDGEYRILPPLPVYVTPEVDEDVFDGLEEENEMEEVDYTVDVALTAVEHYNGRDKVVVHSFTAEEMTVEEMLENFSDFLVALGYAKYEFAVVRNDKK